MTEELKPCPACGASVRLEGGRQWHDRHRFIIRCENLECGCVRIGDTERSECIRRWNSLPRALTWVKELPVEPGQYFCLWSDGSVSAENLTAYIEHWRGEAPVHRVRTRHAGPADALRWPHRHDSIRAARACSRFSMGRSRVLALAH